MTEEQLTLLLAAVDAVDAPPAAELSLRARDVLDAALAKLPPTPRELSDEEMKIVILKILSNGRADGGELADTLADLNIHLAKEGEGLIFALLANMEERGLIIGQFNEARTRKAYSLTADGLLLLERKSAAVRNSCPSLSRLWKTA
jgi:DNA-binding PadR family transcriptional regulator